MYANACNYIQAVMIAEVMLRAPAVARGGEGFDPEEPLIDEFNRLRSGDGSGLQQRLERGDPSAAAWVPPDPPAFMPA